MTRSFFAVLLFAGCQGLIVGGTSTGAGAGAGAGDGAGAGTAGGGASASGGGSGAGGGTTRLVCDPGTHPAAREGRRLTAREYGNAIGAVFGAAVAASPKYPGSFGVSLTGFSTEPALTDVGSSTIDGLLLAAEDVAVDVAATLPTLLPCSATTANDACATSFITTYGRRAYRHTPTADEQASLLKTFHDGRASGASFNEAIAMLTVHLLQAPQFLYLMEDAAPTARALTGPELASRLSFLWSGSVPDDTLLDLAESGALTDATVLEQQASRLLDDGHAEAGMARFFREWTGRVQVTAQSKDPLAFPGFTDAVASSLNASFDAFARDELRGHAPFSTLFQSSSVWVDDASAGWLGLPATGSWHLATLDPSKGAGLATQPALMASLAHERNTSFIFRGKFVLSKLLCQQFGAPPANATTVFASLPLPPNPTGREQSAQINQNPACAGCHTTINPVGLAFEHFDATGRYQATYASGKAIDTAGQVQLGSSPLAFTDPATLMAEVGQRPEAVTCFSKQLFRFTMSRPETQDDGCALQAMTDALTAADGDLRLAVMSMVGSDAFRFKVDQ